MSVYYDISIKALKAAYISCGARAARFHIARIEHICAHVEVCINTGRPLNLLDTDMGTRGWIVDVYIGTLDFSTFDVSTVQVQEKAGISVNGLNTRGKKSLILR